MTLQGQKGNAEIAEKSSVSSGNKVDVNKVMAEIRAQIRRDLQNEVQASVTSSGGERNRRRGILKTLSELNYLNKNYNYPTRTLDPNTVSSHRQFVGKLIAAGKRKLFHLLRQHLFLNYFSAQEEFNANLVRVLNELTDALDTRDARLDADVMGEVFDLEKRFSEELGATLGEVQRQLSDLNLRSLNQEVQVRAVTGISQGLEQIVSLLTSSKRTETGHNVAQARARAASSGEIGALEDVDYSYLLFENRFRGDEALISERLKQYVEIFKGSVGPVLEIGAGRGELQRLFRDAEIESYGLELDDGMLAICAAKGLNVSKGEGLAHLRELADHSLGGLVAIQVVEHLTPVQLRELFELAWRKVTTGGIVAFETINTQSLVALNQTYYRDPTHQQPLHPQTLSFIAEMAGFKNIEIRMLSPFPREAELQKITTTDGMSPRWLAVVETLNRDIEQLNRILFGYQDYCLIGHVG